MAVQGRDTKCSALMPLDQVGCQKKFFSFLSKSGNILEKAAHGGAEVTIPGGARECRDVALRDVVMGMVGVGWGWDW